MREEKFLILKNSVFLFFLFFLITITLVKAAPFMPTILTVEAQNVSGGATAYTNKTTNIIVTGNAESYKKIKVYKDGNYVTPIAETISNSITGAWTVNNVALTAGSHTLTAKASEVLHNGTLYNSPTWVAGKYNSALLFDGTNDYVEVPNYDALNPSLITVEAWINPSAGDYRTIVSKGYQGLDLAYELRITRDIEPIKVFFAVKTTGGWQSAGTYNNIVNNNWYHIVGTYDGSNVNLYINGVLNQAVPLTGSIIGNALPLRIGKLSTGAANTEYFTGIIDDVRVYNRALTGAEVLDRYNNAPISSGLVGEWKFDEGAGVTANDTHTTYEESQPSNVANVVVDTIAPNFSFYSYWDWGTGLYWRRSGWAAGNWWAWSASDSPMCQWGNETDPNQPQWNSIIGIQLEVKEDNIGGVGVDWPNSAKIIIEDVPCSGCPGVDLGGSIQIVDGTRARWVPPAGQYIWGNTNRPPGQGQGVQSAIFQHGKMYRMTTKIKDKVGNENIWTREWICDNTPPTISVDMTKIWIINAAVYPSGNNPNVDPVADPANVIQYVPPPIGNPPFTVPFCKARLAFRTLPANPYVEPPAPFVPGTDSNIQAFGARDIGWSWDGSANKMAYYTPHIENRVDKYPEPGTNRTMHRRLHFIDQAHNANIQSTLYWRDDYAPDIAGRNVNLYVKLDCPPDPWLPNALDTYRVHFSDAALPETSKAPTPNYHNQKWEDGRSLRVTGEIAAHATLNQKIELWAFNCSTDLIGYTIVPAGGAGTIIWTIDKDKDNNPITGIQLPANSCNAGQYERMRFKVTNNLPAIDPNYRERLYDNYWNWKIWIRYVVTAPTIDATYTNPVAGTIFAFNNNANAPDKLTVTIKLLDWWAWPWDWASRWINTGEKNSWYNQICGGCNPDYHSYLELVNPSGTRVGTTYNYTHRRSNDPRIDIRNYYGGTIKAGTHYNKADINTEGTYRTRVYACNTAYPIPTCITQDYIHFLKYDLTAPNVINIFPGNGTVASIPSFNAEIVDPNLADGTVGTGAMLDLSQNQIDPYKKIGSAVATAINTITVPALEPVSGQSVDHRGDSIPVNPAPLPAGSAVQVWDDLTGEIVGIITVGNSLNSNATVDSNSGSNFKVTMTVGSLTIGKSYSIYYLIPHFDSNDSVKKVASVPIQPCIAQGTYCSRITGMDKAGNKATTISQTNIQLNPPTGTITLNANPVDIYISGAGAQQTELTTAIIRAGDQAGGGPAVPDGTLVTVTISGPGILVEPDANGISADGTQVTTFGGVATFHVKEIDNNTYGTVTVSIQCGQATGTKIVYMRKPVIQLTKSSNVTSVPKGATITYTIQYKNIGNSNSVNTIVKEKIPVNVTYTANSTKLNAVAKTDVADVDEVTYNAGILQINLGTLAANDTGNITFDVTAN